MGNSAASGHQLRYRFPHRRSKDANLIGIVKLQQSSRRQGRTPTQRDAIGGNMKTSASKYRLPGQYRKVSSNAYCALGKSV
jgi:hypothetical protein